MPECVCSQDSFRSLQAHPSGHDFLVPFQFTIPTSTADVPSIPMVELSELGIVPAFCPRSPLTIQWTGSCLWLFRYFCAFHAHNYGQRFKRSRIPPKSSSASGYDPLFRHQSSNPTNSAISSPDPSVSRTAESTFQLLFFQSSHQLRYPFCVRSLQPLLDG